MCQELARFGTKLGKIQRRCVRDEREEAAVWSPVDTSECQLSITALQLCEYSLNMVIIIVYNSLPLVRLSDSNSGDIPRRDSIAQYHNAIRCK